MEVVYYIYIHVLFGGVLLTCSSSTTTSTTMLSQKRRKRSKTHCTELYLFFNKFWFRRIWKISRQCTRRNKMKNSYSIFQKLILIFQYILLFIFLKIKIWNFLNRYLSTLCFKYKYKLQEKGSYSSPLSTVLFCTEYMLSLMLQKIKLKLSYLSYDKIFSNSPSEVLDLMIWYANDLFSGRLNKNFSFHFFWFFGTNFQTAHKPKIVEKEI